MENKLANPAPLGLMAFGMTTVLLNIHNAGWIEMSAVILAMGIFYGGCAQIIAGIMEFKKGNTFGVTAFSSYGFFWLTLVFIIYFKGRFGVGPWSPAALGWYLFFWGLFTGVMWIGTLKLNKALQVVFLTLTILFWMLAIKEWFGLTGAWALITGIEGVFCGLSAIYAALAQVLNEVYGKTVWPMGVKE